MAQRFVPTADRRCAISHAQALGVLLRALVVERGPVHGQHEKVHEFGAGLFGISAEQTKRLADDRLGRALDQLFDADRAALLTAVVVAVGRRFDVSFARLHNDSTSVAFCAACVERVQEVTAASRFVAASSRANSGVGSFRPSA